jgi:hypothetical protein
MDEGTSHLTDEEIRTVMPGTAEPVRAQVVDRDGRDTPAGDGTDGDAADQTDGDAQDTDTEDAQDADDTDTQDADGTDAVS